MFNVRPIQPNVEIDARQVYSLTNIVLSGLFYPKDGWVLFELAGRRKYAIAIKDLVDNDHAFYEQIAATKKFPSIPKTLYERMRSHAELNIMMRGR